MLAALAGAAVAATSALPLESVSYVVDVTGPLAEVVIRQRFRNDGRTFLDATYLFPLDDGAVVDGMVMVVGDRTIRSEIRGREEAREAYDQAAAEGRVAALTEQERPNVFTQHVANLPPGEAVDVELRVVQPAERIDGVWQLVLPLVVGPRFVPPGTADDVAAVYALPSEARDRLADDDPRDSETGVLAQIDVVVHAGVPIRALTSPSHAIEPTVDEADGSVVLDGVPLTRDLVLEWSTSGEQPLTGLLVAGRHAMLVVEPPESMPFTERVPREVVWVVDTSGSMLGAPLDLAKQAMARALRTMDPRDSFVVLGFGNQVTALDARPVPATMQNVARGLQFVESLTSSGGTYMMPALETALDLPIDPERRRTVVFVTDGLIANDPEVLAHIARQQDVTFVSLGIGAAPNRWLLDEMATLGGGVAAYALVQQDAGDAMDGLVAAMDRPVWSGLAVDWGDCAPVGLAPARAPDLRNGRPLRILARVDGPCTGEVYVTARDGQGAVTVPVEPQRVPHDRAMASTWARERVADLERRRMRGELGDVAEAVREIGLSSGIVTSQTSLVAVDTRVVNPTGVREWADQPLDLPDGLEASAVEVCVVGQRLAVDVESTSRGVVVTKEFLSRVPAGRDYASAVQAAAGVAGNPNLAGGAYNENTFLLDGANVTDPVAGAFSLNFNLDAIQQIDVIDLGRLPEFPGGDAVVNVVSASGTNQLEARVGVAGAASDLDPTRGGAASAGVAGPLVRDRLWLAADAATTVERFAGVESHVARVFGKLTHQPVTEHRFTLEGAGDPSSVELRDVREVYGGGVGTARWQWFASPEVSADTVGSATVRRVGAIERTRAEGGTTLRALSVDDPLGGTHDLAAGLQGARLGWSGAGEALAATLLTGFAQDEWRPGHTVTLEGGARVEAVGDGDWQVLPSPRAFVAWDPWGDRRTRLGGGYGRYVDPSRLAPGVAPPVTDEVHAVAEREVLPDLAVLVTGSLARERFAFLASPDLVPLPAGPVERLDRTVPRLEVGLRKVAARRWAADAGWAFTPEVPADEALLRDPSAPFVPGFLTAYRRHALSAGGSWALPTDPWTLSVGGFARWASAIRDGAGAWWLGQASALGVTLTQTLPARRGRVDLRTSLARVTNDVAGTVLPLEAYALVPGLPPIGEQPPLRFDAGVTYRF